jgi:hypothetical protein
MTVDAENESTRMHGGGMRAAVPAPQLSRWARAAVAVVYVLVAAAVVLPLVQQVVVPIATRGAAAAGWSWGSLLAVLALSVAALALFGWELHRAVNTQLDEEGLQVPGLRGRKRIPWSRIERVSGRGLRIRLHTASETVTVNPLCYARPGQVVPFLLRKIPVRLVGGSGT